MGPQVELAAVEAGSLIEQLQNINEQLLSQAVRGLDQCNWDGPDRCKPDLDAITDAIGRRGQLVIRVGRLLRDSRSLRRAGDESGWSTYTGFRASLEQALEDGECAVASIMSHRAGDR